MGFIKYNIDGVVQTGLHFDVVESSSSRCAYKDCPFVPNEV